MQLNWLYFCGICQMMLLKVWPNTALGCNHQSDLHAPVTAFMYSCSGTQCILPRRDEGSGKPMFSDRSLIVHKPPLRIRTRAAGFKIISGDHYTTTKHAFKHILCVQCTQSSDSLALSIPYVRTSLGIQASFVIGSWPLSRIMHFLSIPEIHPFSKFSVPSWKHTSSKLLSLLAHLLDCLPGNDTYW